MRPPAWALVAIVACGRLAPGEPSPGPPPPQGPPAQVWLTTGDGSKLLSREADVHFDSGTPPATLLRIVVDEGTTYQEMVGFGAAITDASAWLIQNKLTPVQREDLLQELFGPSPGLGLNFTRLTMARPISPCISTVTTTCPRARRIRPWRIFRSIPIAPISCRWCSAPWPSTRSSRSWRRP